MDRITVIPVKADTAARTSTKGRGMRVAGLVLPLLLSTSPTLAAGRSLTTVWMVEEAPARPDAFDVASRDYVIRQRLLPIGLAELADASGQPRPEGLVAGKQLIEIQSSDALVFCDPVIRPRKLVGHAQQCLVDADRDGRFEGIFTTTSVTKGIVTIQGSRPKQARAVEPIPYRRIDPRRFEQQLFVGIQYRGNANLFGNHVFEIRYGSEEQMGSLTRRLFQKKAEVPGSMDVLGGRFTILAAGSESIRVQVDRPFPSQPFGVVQTTTYRIY